MRITILFFYALCLVSCSQETDQKTKLIEKFEQDKSLPEVQLLTQTSTSVFLPTFESKIISKKNNIYAASLLFAWEEVRQALPTVLSGFSNKELELINNSTSYKNTLDKSEYITNVEISNNEIKTEAYFKINLPFPDDLTVFEDPLVFMDREVASFGFYGECSFAKIVYYNHDEDFCIMLHPQNKEHCIILVTYDFEPGKSFDEYLIEIGKKERSFKMNLQNNYWNSIFNEEDSVVIPRIAFNFEHHYTGLVNSTFKSGTVACRLDRVSQKTAFVLNEKGAVIESGGNIDLSHSHVEQQPKQLIFDRPFFVFAIKMNQTFPYFALLVNNPEILEPR